MPYERNISYKVKQNIKITNKEIIYEHITEIVVKDIPKITECCVDTLNKVGFDASLELIKVKWG